MRIASNLSPNFEAIKRKLKKKMPEPPPLNPSEPVLTDEDKRLFLFPLKYKNVFDHYKKHCTTFWTVEEVDLARDYLAYEKLEKGTQKFIAMTLAFFSQADAVVMENINDNFAEEMKPLEHRLFLSIQVFIEGVHSEMYAQLLQEIVRDKEERTKMIHGISTYECLKDKHDWCVRYMDRKKPFASRLLAFTILEGVFFSSAFCSIYYIKKQGIEMPGLISSNEFISRDEGLHRDFGVMVYKDLKNKLSQDEAHKMFKAAVSIENRCIREAIPVALIGINADTMLQYVQFVADGLLQALGYDKIWHQANPFEWMELISLQRKGNFFENRVSEYARADLDFKFSLDDDF